MEFIAKFVVAAIVGSIVGFVIGVFSVWIENRIKKRG